jgi:predicted CoA-substrate-specific enzyme activase
LPSCPVAATGYGRDLLDATGSVPTITEIKAHALGARFFHGSCSAVIDIGGQDIKVISLDEAGRVNRFEMNDRCAAGSGRFLEIMAERLGFSLGEFGDAALKGKKEVTISSMCTVFAESEVVGLLNSNVPRQDIAAALHKSIVKRIHSMVNRANPDSSCIVATGGGAKNRALISFLQTSLGADVVSSPECQAAGAIGCAVYAARLNEINAA